MKTLFLDCSFGIAGDMFLAASCGLGLDLAPLQDAFSTAGLELTLDAPEVRIGGLAGRQLAIESSSSQPLRHLPDILKIIEALPLSDDVRAKASVAFTRLGEAEAAVHGMPLDHVHFHEVGAVDTLIDVVGAFYAVEQLGVSQVQCSPLPWFRGRVHCAHGILPLPAPAALELMKGKPVFPSDFELEIITPTGALIVDQLTDSFATGPTGVVVASGVGYGTTDLGDKNRGLRALLIEPWQ